MWIKTVCKEIKHMNKIKDILTIKSLKRTASGSPVRARCTGVFLQNILCSIIMTCCWVIQSYSRSVNILFFLRKSFCKHAKWCLFHVCWRVKVTDVQLDELLPFVGKLKCLICTITVHFSHISCVHVSGSPCVPVCTIIS